MLTCQAQQVLERDDKLKLIQLKPRSFSLVLLFLVVVALNRFLLWLWFSIVVGILVDVNISAKVVLNSSLRVLNW